VWAAPVGWCAVAGVAVRAGRLEPVAAGVAAGVVLLAVGLARHLAGGRGGAAGRAADLLLLLTSLGLLLAEPGGDRALVAQLGALGAAGLTAFGILPRAGVGLRPWLLALLGGAAGASLAPGLAGGAWWGLGAAASVLALAGVGWALGGVAPPALAAAATVAVAAAVGPGDPRALALPLLAAVGLWGLARRRSVLVAVAGVAAAAVPPAGLALSVALLAVAARQDRSPLPLLGLLPALVVAFGLLPEGVALVHAPRWRELVPALPLSLGSLPVLLPLVVAGLGARRSPDGDARDGLVAGLILLPLVGGGGSSAVTAAALWLLAVPAAASPARARTVAATLPWTFAAAGALLLLAPWGGAELVAVRQPHLTAGWALALLLTGLPVRAAALAFVLPAAGLLWTLPVEGRDRVLAAGDRLRLPAGEQVLLVGLSGSAGGVTAGAPVLAPVEGAVAPVVAGADCPLPLAPARRPLAVPRGPGAGTAAGTRAVVRRTGPAELEARASLVVRLEPGQAWRARRVRLGALLAGALALLLLAHLHPRARAGPLAVGAVVLLGAVVASGCSGLPLARTAVRAAPDLAVAAALAAWLALEPALRRRRFAAGVLLLVPLALAQPLLRPPAGDEVYHLQLLESLATDRDLAVADNLDPRRPDEAQYLPYGDRLIHSPLLALGVLPGFLVAGHAGAVALLAVAVAAALALVARRAEELGAPRAAVTWGWSLALLTYPTLTFATQLWPDGAAVLLVALLLHAAARPSPGVAAVAAAGALLLKVRLGLIALPLALASVRGRWRALALLALAVMAAVGAVWFLLGGPLERHSMAELVPASATRPLLALWGLAFDPAGGLAFSAPLWLAGACFLPAVWRRGGGGERALMAGGALTLAVLVLRREGEWFGGGSPPARYLVPLLPLALLALVEALRSRHGRMLVRLALPWAAVAAWVSTTRPLALFNSGDGGWWLGDSVARALSGPARSLFPSVIRPGLATLLVPLLLLGAAVLWQRRARSGAVGATMVALALLAALTAGGRVARVHAEDPQVRHRGGRVDPPAGTVGRASRVIAWRLPAGAALEVPWRPWQGRRLVARVRLDGVQGAGRLEASWDGGVPLRVEVRGARWTQVALPPPPTLGRGRLRLEWSPGSSGELLVDWVGVGDER